MQRGTPIEYECPACGEALDRREDRLGVCYQCPALDCLSFFDASEIETQEEDA